MRERAIILVACLALVLVGPAAWAQSSTTPAAQTTTATPSAAAGPPSTTASGSTQGAFDSLSPGNQKIATALCNAQPGGCSSGQPATQNPSASTQPLTRDQIAVMKQHRGWGEIFKQMQKSGQIPPEVKNLGQLVSGQSQAHSGAAGTTITTGSGKSQVVGSSGGQSGRGQADDAGSAASLGGGSRSSAGSHGGGRGK